MADAAFRRLDDSVYSLAAADGKLEFLIDRLRWQHDELFAQLTVTSTFPGARTVDGLLLSQGTFNLSSARARRERANDLRDRLRASTPVDMIGMLELLCCRVLAAERRGDPAILLRDVPPPMIDPECNLDGFRFPTEHPTIVFGDGGTLKSMLALHTAGVLAQQGMRAALFDWELDAGQHRLRLERLFGANMPDVRYVHCDRPLVYEVDRLRKIVRDDRLDFAIFDSIGFACPGPPEAAEHAMSYFRAVRQLRIGSLHVAHIRQGDDNDRKPFGSVFWHNAARSTWFVKLAEISPDGRCLTIGLFNRKSNLSALWPPVSYRVEFVERRTYLTPADVMDTPAAAGAGVPLWQRMKTEILTRGPQTLAELRETLNANVDTLDKTVRRKHELFRRILGSDGISRIDLVVERESA